MSIENPNQHDYHVAGLRGLAHMHGGDPEVLRDLGIPVDGEDLSKQLESAAAVKQAMIPKVGHLVSERDQWVADMHLSHPSSSGPIPRATDEQRADVAVKKDLAKQLIRPLGDRPATRGKTSA